LIAAYHGATTPPLPDLDRRPAFNSANYMSSWLSRRNIAYRLFNHGGARRRAAGRLGPSSVVPATAITTDRQQQQQPRTYQDFFRLGH